MPSERSKCHQCDDFFWLHGHRDLRLLSKKPVGNGFRHERCQSGNLTESARWVLRPATDILEGNSHRGSTTAVATLKVLKGLQRGQTFELSSEKTVLGRHPTNHVVLDNVAVSRHHAQIIGQADSFYVEDLKSLNGTQVNDRTIRGKHPLRDGDIIRVCDFVFEFHDLPGRDETDRTRVQSGSRRTRPQSDAPSESEHPLLVLEPSSAPVGGSSILSTLDVTNFGQIQFLVRPETKLLAILEVTSALGRKIDLDEVLPTILKTLFKIFPQAEWGFVLLNDAEAGRLSLRATYTRSENSHDEVPVSMTIIREAIEKGRAILSADATGDARFKESESLALMQIRSVMCVPLMSNAQTPLGVIQLSTRDISQQFTNDDLDLLVCVATQATLALDNASMHEAVLRQRDLDRELEFATQVQLGFLPSERPRMPGYDFADYYEAAHHVGGDYFDYIPLNDGRMVVAVADVAGKGVPAALLMARLYAAARFRISTTSSLAGAAAEMNREVSTSGLGHRFITLIMAMLSPQTGHMTIVNAGHLPPLVKRQDGTVEVLGLKQSGMPLGIAPQDAEYEELEVELQPGEMILFYTDGVTEAMTADHVMFSRKRLVAALAAHRGTAVQFVSSLMEQLDTFQDDVQQRDDVCIVAIQRRGEGFTTASTT